jgi:hypothetical protein
VLFSHPVAYLFTVKIMPYCIAYLYHHCRDYANSYLPSKGNSGKANSHNIKKQARCYGQSCALKVSPG